MALRYRCPRCHVPRAKRLGVRGTFVGIGLGLVAIYMVRKSQPHISIEFSTELFDREHRLRIAVRNIPTDPRSIAGRLGVRRIPANSHLLIIVKNKATDELAALRWTSEEILQPSNQYRKTTIVVMEGMGSRVRAKAPGTTKGDIAIDPGTYEATILVREEGRNHQEARDFLVGANLKDLMWL